MTSMRTLAGLLAALSLLATAQNAPGAPIAQVEAAEKAMWQAYNSCDYAAFGSRLAADVEFYHDLGGVMKGRQAVVDAVRNSICGNPKQKTRREGAGDIKVFPLKQGEQVYGAVVSGSHVFHGKLGAAAEEPQDKARFTHVWLKKGGAWELSRVLSYDHQPFGAAPATPAAAAPLSAAQIDRYVGNFTGPGMPPLAFSRTGDNLTVAFEGKQLVLHPLAKANTFLVKENNTEVEFADPAGGRANSVVIRLNGRPIEEAKRQ
jgi:hypothetical protein